MIDEMRGYLEEAAPISPDPHARKCRKCSVRDACSFRIEMSPQKNHHKKDQPSRSKARQGDQETLSAKRKAS
jgi:hypothetical protein